MSLRPYYDHGGIQIFHGDCREILPGLGKFDLLLTDPPYGIGLKTDNRTRDQRPSARGAHVWRCRDHAPVFGDSLGFFPEAKTVIDPYMGSGPVAKACKDRGLKYVGIELVEKYCEIAAKRLAQEVLFA